MVYYFKGHRMLREAILKGNIILPQQIVELVGSQYSEEMHNMFNALVHTFIKNEGSVSAPYWSDRFNNNKVFNKFIIHLSKAGWITTNVEPHRNWAEISFNGAKLLKWLTIEEITTMRETVKLGRYLLDTECNTYTPNRTKTTIGVKTVGHVRKGIAKHSHTKFSFDTAMMAKYRDAIILNTTKGIRTLKLDHTLFTDKAHYEAISISCIDHYINHPEESYVLGEALSDSRGRAIYSCTSKVFNPIGFKDARALLVTSPTTLNQRAIRRIHLAIAELLGDKSPTVLKKQAVGFKALNHNTLLDLDLSTEDGRKDLHNNIWLERIYANWKEYKTTQQWTVPIELDQSASMLQIEGVLLNSLELTSVTNLVGDVLTDPWYVEGLSRTHVKSCMTPSLYGSSQNPADLWTDKNLEFTTSDVKLIHQELLEGPYAIANNFKDYIINNVKPLAVMTVTVWNETFTVYCNKFKHKGEVTSRYDVYNSKKGIVETVYHTSTSNIPDLDSFKRYFVTLLIHGIDSQIMDTIAYNVNWSIPIFDAAVVNPVEASIVEDVFIDRMEELYANRSDILSNYFKSIGITSQSATQWKAVTRLITPLTSFKPSTMSLK